MRLKDAPTASSAGVSLERWDGTAWHSVAIDAEFAGAFTDEQDVPPGTVGHESHREEAGSETESAAAAENRGAPLEFEPGMQAVLLLPGSWVWNGLETVPRAARRQSSAVGYIVEERLAEDVEDLHFTCDPVAGDLCSIMAISQNKLDALHAQIMRLQWPVTVAIPEYRLLSALGGEHGIWLDGARAHLWQGSGIGMTVDRSLLLPIAESLFGADEETSEEIIEASAGSDESAPIAVLGPVETLEQGGLSQLGRVEAQTGQAETYLLEQYSPAATGNLLSGAYQVVLGTAEGPWWRVPAIAVAACFVAQLVFFVGAGMYYKVQAGHAEDAAQQLFQEIFPGVRPQADLRRQITGFLNQSRGGGSDFARQLQQLSSVWNGGKSSELKLQSLRFDGTRGELVLQLRAADLAQLDSVVNKLSNSQFKAELLAANELEEGVSGRIRLR